jgi:membrane-anchored protein YejM (alkaline phosphatase superfamily)
MVIEQDLSLVNKIDRLLRWGHWYTFFNVLLALLITGSYFFADPWPATATGWVYLLVNWLGHTAFLCFLYFIVTIFPISLLFPSQKHVRGIGAILSTLGLVALIFDAYVYHSLGYHAGSASYEQTIDLLRQQVVTNLRNFILITTTVASILLALQLVISNYCWKKVERLKRSGIGHPALSILLGSFVLSHLIHIWADAVGYQDITRQDNTLPLSYPATARTVLARYQLLDPSQMSKKSAEGWLAQAGVNEHPVVLQCKVPSDLKPLQIWVVPGLTAEQNQLLQLQSFKKLPQHMAPVDSKIAIVNLLSAQLASKPKVAAPAWLQQLPVGLWGYQSGQLAEQRSPWLVNLSEQNATTIQWFLPDDTADLTSRLKQRAADEQMLVIEMNSQNEQFAVGQSQVWYYWPALHQQRISQVSQHLDIVPTLLAYAGCVNEHRWIGDNLLAPVQQAKLNIVGHQLFSFRKDKMLVVNEDGQFSVWSAGTLVPLEQKPDLPMLTDALNRLPRPANSLTE